MAGLLLRLSTNADFDFAPVKKAKKSYRREEILSYRYVFPLLFSVGVVALTRTN